MNARERFLALMRYDDVDRLPFWDLEGITEQAVRQWCLEGMPIGVNVDEHVGYDSRIQIPLSTEPIPSWVQRTITSDDEWVTYTDAYGFTVRRSRQQAVAPIVYYYVAGSLESMDGWPDIQRRYDPLDPRRLPKSWSPELLQHYREATCPVGLRLHWGPGRGIKNGYMFGLEEFLRLVAEEPATLEPIFEHSVWFMIELCRDLLAQVPIDYVILMDDGMAYKNSSLVSPASFRRLWQPVMRRLTDFWRSHNIPCLCYYTSGNIEPLMPTLLDTGFNVFAPLEVAADMDAHHLRKRFGREALLWGNIGRQALMDGPQAIDESIAALEPLIAEGGFMPVVDDMILPDISYASFMHYAERIRGYRF